jgi:hypothetical protein
MDLHALVGPRGSVVLYRGSQGVALTRSGLGSPSGIFADRPTPALPLGMPSSDQLESATVRVSCLPHLTPRTKFGQHGVRATRAFLRPRRREILSARAPSTA